jgi:hypothetical protein
MRLRNLITDVLDWIRWHLDLPLSGDIAHQRWLDSLQYVGSKTDEFYDQCVELKRDAAITATDLYETYCSWMEGQEFAPAALPTFARETNETGIFDKEKVGGRVVYRVKPDADPDPRST